MFLMKDSEQSDLHILGLAILARDILFEKKETDYRTKRT